MTITTGLLVDYPEAMSPLVDLLESQWADWYNPRGASARADLSERMQRNGLPLGLVAFDDAAVVGTCALTVTSGGLVTERSPWLGGLIVHPTHRRRGVAAALLARARQEARRLGHRRLYALTADAAALFESQGWSVVDVVSVSGAAHSIFATAT